MADKVEIPIHIDVWKDILEYSAWAYKHYKSEVGGYAHFNKDTGIYKIAPLCDQICHGAETDINLIRILNSDYDMSDMTVWWHSHPNMSTTPSSTDWATIRKWGEKMRVSIMLIVNLEMVYTCKAFAMNEFDKKSEYDVTLIPYFDRAKLSQEVQGRVSRPKPQPAPKEPTKTATYYHNSNRWIDKNGKEFNYKNVGFQTKPSEDKQQAGNKIIITPDQVVRAEVIESENAWVHWALHIQGLE